MEEEPARGDRAVTNLGIDDYRIPPSNIQAARDLLTGIREQVRCGRPTRSGTACGQLKARLLVSCRVHATLGERTAAEVERVRLTAVVDDWSNSLAPACHAWPVTDDDRRLVAALPRLPDDELREARLVHDLIADWQDERCAVCGGSGDHSLVLDHDHVTALVRGYLCRSCNTTEPHADWGDFTKYRARPPAVLLGVTARYEHPWYGRLVQPEPLLVLSHDRHPSYALMADLDRTDDPAPR